MPTPTRYFVDVAVRYGDIDSRDLEAVQQWFIEVLPTLPHDVINEIFEELLANNASVADDHSEPAYPKGVPLPSLSASPPAPIPLLAVRINELLTKLIRRNKT